MRRCPNILQQILPLSISTSARSNNGCEFRPRASDIYPLELVTKRSLR
jgi:hypothetical protein